MPDPSTAPVLLLIFNRPDAAARVFERVRQARPATLYVAADGPRESVHGEKRLCAEARRAATNVDWPCDVKTLFREGNLGLRAAVSGALNWFFGQEEEGIVLEDDCVPSGSFFPFCTELLERYRHTPEVMAVSGVNFQFGAHKTPYSYYFSRYNHCWGWASWSRSWEAYDNDMTRWPQAREDGTLGKVLGDPEAARYWKEAFDKAYRNEVDSWAYRWTLSTWLAGGVAVLPTVNLVTNIGFGDEATHTRGRSLLACMKTGEITFPLRHPPGTSVDENADRRTFDTCYRRTLSVRIRNKLGHLFRCRGPNC
ncbi:MAG: glycosyltransferase family 2 protein [bacterium]|nr:glycosyltransferase family 2 protein [bacterium]